ncbi:MAG TPA: PLP-dependent aminotransferase family protein [Casimicrobiaceae bacterium]|jgi:GntR family transcriptional regulator/MocR family aminotransferase
MEPEFEVSLALPARRARTLLRDLHAQLRAAILDGRLRSGLRLPTTRAFAAAYGVSRNTAIGVYDLLQSEGYLFARGKAGTYVADALPQAVQRKRSVVDADRQRLNPFWRGRSVTEPRRAPRFEFRLGVPDVAQFPFTIWRRLSARALQAQSKSPAAYAEPQGRPALRAAIAQHVSFARAVACQVDDVVVTAGAQQAFDLLARILVTPGRGVVALEDPGYPPTRAAFAAAGAKTVAVPVDREGLIVERLPQNTRVVCVTPSHQFPLGVAMSARRRAGLLEFARRRGAVVIEDDYDGEFRFGGRALDALQTLDRHENVFYVGTFSKSLFPALRLGFVAAPPWARAALVAAKHFADWHCPVVEQDTLAAFIADGHLARHVRKMRRIYATRRDLLLRILQRDFRRWLEPVPATAGLHLAALAVASLDIDVLVAHARRNDVGVYALRNFYTGKSVQPGLVFGYGASNEQTIVEGLARLRRICAG